MLSIYGFLFRKYFLEKIVQKNWLLNHFVSLCVTEKRTYINKRCNLQNPSYLTVLLSILFNKSPWSDSSSQASNDGREDSKDKDMKPSDGRKTNGSHEPPPQYADMAGQVPTSPGVSHLYVF